MLFAEDDADLEVGAVFVAACFAGAPFFFTTGCCGGCGTGAGAVTAGVGGGASSARDEDEEGVKTL